MAASLLALAKSRYYLFVSSMVYCNRLVYMLNTTGVVTILV